MTVARCYTVLFGIVLTESARRLKRSDVHMNFAGLGMMRNLSPLDYDLEQWC